MSIVFSKTIEIDESNFTELKSIRDYNAVDLSNDSGMEIDVNAFYDHLKKVKGIDGVDALRISHSSYLKNVEVIKAFPNLRVLCIYGYKITSLDGLERLKKGEYIEIKTEKNRKRNIEKISAAPIERMTLGYGRKEDFNAIGSCLALKMLEISKSPSPEFYDWRNIPVSYLKFSRGTFNELCDMVHMKTLDQLFIGACRKFERFKGDNSCVRWVIIVGCKRFDIRSISSLQGVEQLTVNSCANEIALSDLPEHSTVRSLSLLTCKVNVDIYDLKKKMPKLEDFTASKITKEQAVLLSRANSDCSISVNNIKFLNGACIES